jgi:hypothetical protein
MAYSIVSLDHYKHIKVYTDALAEHEGTFDYGEGVSLAHLIAANDNAKAKLKIRNEALQAFLKADAELDAAKANAENLVIKLRSCIKGVKGEDSAEFVAIGGKRRSEITAQARATRIEKQKASAQKPQNPAP